MNTQEQIQYIEKQLEKYTEAGPLRDGLQQKLLELHMEVLKSTPVESSTPQEELPDAKLPPTTKDAPPYPDGIAKEARKTGPMPHLLGAEDKRVAEDTPKAPALRSARSRSRRGEFLKEDIPAGWLTIKQWLATQMNIPLEDLSQSLGTSFSMHCRPFIEDIPYFMTGEGKRMMTKQYYYPPAIKNYLLEWYDSWLARSETLERLRQENLVPLPPKFGLVSFVGWMVGSGQAADKVQNAANMFYDWIRDNWSNIKRSHRVQLNSFEKGDFPQYLNGRYRIKDHLDILYAQFYLWIADAGKSAFSLLNLTLGARTFAPSPVPFVPLHKRENVSETLQQIVDINIDELREVAGDKAVSAYLTKVKIIISSSFDVSTGVALNSLREILVSKLNRTIALRAQGFRWSEYCKEYLAMDEKEKTTTVI